MIKFVEHRVADRRILRLIQKWLRVGVMEEGKWSETETGTPQGSVISPMFASVYHHYAFDLWVEVRRRKYVQGEVVVVRNADDAARNSDVARQSTHGCQRNGIDGGMAGGYGLRCW
jgi:RNA-directed DNA polymerase